MTDLAAGAGPVRLAVLPEAARFGLRVGAADLGAVSAVFGVALPGRIGDSATTGARSALCLGPDEWLLYVAEEDAAALQEAFAAIDAAAPHSLVDISDRECAIAISGDCAAELLSTGCPRDVEAMLPGTGVRTIFDTAQVVLFRDAETVYRMECGRSYFPHVWALLNAANQEFGSGF